MPAGWVTADEVYGGSPALRGWLETRQLPFVLAVKCTEPLAAPSGPPTPAARLADHVRRRAGCASAPAGAPRAAAVGVEPGGAQRRWRVGWAGRWLLVRRSLRTGG